MGDNISPGEIVIACAWMEKEYMQTLQDEDKKHFTAGRYMDDVILIYKEGGKWDSKKFQDKLTKHCYAPPLTLEPSKEGVFLETEFEIVRNKIVHRLKMIIKMHFNRTFGDINTITVLLPMSGRGQLSWLHLTKYNFLPQIGSNVPSVEYSKQESSWQQDTLTQ